MAASNSFGLKQRKAAKCRVYQGGVWATCAKRVFRRKLQWLGFRLLGFFLLVVLLFTGMGFCFWWMASAKESFILLFFLCLGFQRVCAILEIKSWMRININGNGVGVGVGNDYFTGLFLFSVWTLWVTMGCGGKGLFVRDRHCCLDCVWGYKRCQSVVERMFVFFTTQLHRKRGE